MRPCVLTDTDIAMSFPDYGIDIPVLDSRVRLTLEALLAHPVRNLEIVDRVSVLPVRDDLYRVHERDFVDRLLGSGTEGELKLTYELVNGDGSYNRYRPEAAVKPLSALVNTIFRQVGGTCEALERALVSGFCYYLGGGMHHAHYDHGSGFCPLNDSVIAIRRLQAAGTIRHAWIIDVDAHKGDGTAALTAGDDSILTLSIHMAEGWPLDPETTAARGADNPSLIPSDVELPVPAGHDGEYNGILEAGLECLAELSRQKQGGAPDAVIVVDGSDPYMKDELPSSAGLALSLGQMMDRDRILYRYLQGANPFGHRIPAAWIMAGGYGASVWEVYARFLTWVDDQLQGS